MKRLFKSINILMDIIVQMIEKLLLTKVCSNVRKFNIFLLNSPF